MTVLILMIVMLLFGYQMGRIRFEERLKKIAYCKHFDIAQTDLHLNVPFNAGLCDGMTYLVEEMTGDKLMYWNGET